MTALVSLLAVVLLGGLVGWLFGSFVLRAGGLLLALAGLFVLAAGGGQAVGFVALLLGALAWLSATGSTPTATRVPQPARAADLPASPPRAS
jgi:hypothetical protein